MLPIGIDAWWLDATEPENDDLVGRRVNHSTFPGEVFRNVYPLVVNKTIYEGLRGLSTDEGNNVILFLELFCLPVADFLAFSDMGLLLGLEMSGMTGIHFVVRLLQDWVFLFVVCLGGLMMLEDSFVRAMHNIQMHIFRSVFPDGFRLLSFYL